MCSISINRKTVEQFLAELEPELEKYAKPLRDLGFTTTNMLKFLKLKDLQSMPCGIPAPHRRMILNEVAKLQSPNTKNTQIDSPDVEHEETAKRNKRRKTELDDTEEDMKPPNTFEPRTLFPKDNSTKTSAYEITHQEKLELETQLIRLKTELTEFKTPPVELMPLALPGHRLMTVTCAQCHHRGHRKEGNKNGENCDFEPCVGFHYCGNEKLHPEFKTKKREKEKAVKVLEAKIKKKADEVLQLEEFAEKNQTNFIRNVRPRLLRLFPQLYKGKDGMQRLLRDVRFLKISCDGKIPPVTENDKENLRNLIQNAKHKVSDDMGFSPESGNFLKPDSEVAESSTSSNNATRFSIDNNTHVSQDFAHNLYFSNSDLPMTMPLYSSNIHEHQLPLLNKQSSAQTHTQNHFFPYGTNFIQANMPMTMYLQPQFYTPQHAQSLFQMNTNYAQSATSSATHDHGEHSMVQNASRFMDMEHIEHQTGQEQAQETRTSGQEQRSTYPNQSLLSLASVALQEEQK